MELNNMTPHEKLTKIKAKCEALIDVWNKECPEQPSAIAGWKATIAAIDLCLNLPSPDSNLILSAILAAWPEELL